jgi:hypothetical protein
MESRGSRCQRTVLSPLFRLAGRILSHGAQQRRPKTESGASENRSGDLSAGELEQLDDALLPGELRGAIDHRHVVERALPEAHHVDPAGGAPVAPEGALAVHRQ